MRYKIPFKLLMVALLLDFGVGGYIYYQNSLNPVLPLDGELCEQGINFSFTGYHYTSFPIDYTFHPNLPDRFHVGITKAFDEWNSIVEGDIFVNTFSFNPTLQVDFGDVSFSGPQTLAVTQTYPAGQGSATANSVITFSNQKPFSDINFSCDLLPITYDGPFDIMSVMVHELGHVLGLDHTDDEFTSLHTYYSGTFAQTLSQGEIDGFFALYDDTFDPPN